MFMKNFLYLTIFNTKCIISSAEQISRISYNAGIFAAPNSVMSAILVISFNSFYN